MVSERIGQGGMSSVFRGQWDGAAVAIKVLHHARSHKSREMFLREVEALSELRHPRICSLFGFTELDGKDALVLEYLPCSLFELLRSLPHGQLRSLLRPIAWDTACALAHLHTNGYMHRDIKTSNVLLSDGHVAKVADFGIAKYVRSPGDKEHTSGLGTLRYMAPEVSEGSDYDSRCDIYSFGLLLWEMVCPGRIAFEGLSGLAACAAAARGERPPLPGPVEADDTAEVFNRLMAQCWASLPHERISLSFVMEALRPTAERTVTSCAPGSSASSGPRAGEVQLPEFPRLGVLEVHPYPVGSTAGSSTGGTIITMASVQLLSPVDIQQRYSLPFDPAKMTMYTSILREGPSLAELMGQAEVKLSEAERDELRVGADSEGRLVYALTGKPLGSSPSSQIDSPLTFIYVMLASGAVFACTDDRTTFHRTLADEVPVAAAGELVVVGGHLASISNKSGHYCPLPESLRAVMSVLLSQGVQMRLPFKEFHYDGSGSLYHSPGASKPTTRTSLSDAAMHVRTGASGGSGGHESASDACAYSRLT